ncbi:WD40 repeat domain-containing protein [Myxococcus faecalis]|uniref:WD40 repeat domain-containing protein n=1 Tax=Myxococcus faecalis TaxID=3115646 RepID=UPI0038CF9883
MKQDRHLRRSSKRLEGHSTPLLAADWLPDSSRLVSAAEGDSTVRVWDVAAARTVSTLTVAEGLNKVRLFPTGDVLAATFEDQVARVYALGSGRMLESAPLATRPRALVVSADGAVYWAGHASQGDRVWSWTPGSTPKPLLKDIHTFEPTCGLALSDDGTKLWCFFEWDLVVLDARTGQELSRFKGARDEAIGPGFVLPTGPRVVGVKSRLNRDDDAVRPRLYRWDHETGGADWSSEILGYGHGQETLLAMARSTRWLAASGSDGVTLVSSRSGRVLGVLSCEVSPWDVSCLSVSPNDRFVAVGTSKGDLFVHELGDTELERDLAVPDISKRSRSGSPLLLRLQKRPGLWLRVHANGDLETAEGDARTDSVIMPLGAQAGGAAAHPSFLAWELSRRLWSYDLTQPLPSKRAHAVQVFNGTDLVVEGCIGIEGSERDIGFDSEPDSVGERVEGALSAWSILDGLKGLLSSRPGGGD